MNARMNPLYPLLKRQPKRHRLFAGVAIASLALLTLSGKASAADPTAQGGMAADMPMAKSAAAAAPSDFGHTHVPASAAAPSHFGHTHLPTAPVKSQPIDAAAPMAGMAMTPMPDSGAPMTAMPTSAMKMGTMTGGVAPSDARDPDAYAEGYEYTAMPGMEHTDLIAFRTVLIDELEFLSGNEGEGVAWSAQANYGGPSNKLWLRTQGLKTPGELDPTTGGEALWWRPYTAFWGTQLGVRQDFGAGAHTWLAAGVEGLAPYWFNVEVTGYVGDDGRLSARLKTAYDLRFTNRMILVPSIEANAYSKAENQRGLGTGLGNIEAGLRLRYELHRKFAPYVGYVLERSFAGTADLGRAEGKPVNEHRFAAGLKLWW